MQTRVKVLAGAIALLAASAAGAQITFYENEGFRGRNFTTDTTVGNFERYGFNDRASSVVVKSGRWEVCENARFSGHCVILRPGRYESLYGMRLNDRISSVRAVSSTSRYEEVPPPVAYEYARRPDERLYEARVTSVHAVMGPPEQRCWVERQQVVEDRGGANVPGAIIGGVVGGVLGHQIGGGRGRDVATVGGAVAGAAIGANVNHGGGATYDQDVQRCENAPSGANPAYWDVTYDFRGIEHRAQLSAPPGATIAVNGNGEPRG
jgi:uncharacterized protein YcfJ